MFISDGLNAIINAGGIISLVFGSATGLMALLKFLKGQKADKIIENEDKTFTVYKGGKYLKVENKVISLYRDYKLRRGFQDLVAPLSKDGIEDLAILKEGENEPLCQIKKEEKDWFLCPDSKEEQIEEPRIFETYISLINLSFKEGNKWFVNDGNENFYVVVEDVNFLKQIDDSFIKFSKGDILKVKVRKIQFYNIDKKSLRSDCFIEKVLEHKTPQQTASLFNNL